MKYYFIFLLMLLLSCRNSSLVSRTPQTIHVTGYSELKVQPDIANLTLNAVSRSDKKTTVISDINGMVDSLLNGIKIKQIKTEKPVINDLNIWWNYIEVKDKQRIIEYTATQTIEIKMDLNVNEIEKLLQIAREIPKLNFSINFDISKLKRDSLENILSKMAIEDAARKAFNMASASNLKIIKILDITYQTDHPGAFMKTNIMQREFAGDGSDKINLSPKEIELNDNIIITYMAGKN